jgi:hypothetical protein
MLKIKDTSFMKCMYRKLHLIEPVTKENENGIQFFTNLKMNKFVIYHFY